MKRREFIAGLGGAAAWPLAARAQEAAMPVVGFLDFGSLGPGVAYGDLFVQGLAETGLVPGRNVAIEYRWANNQGQGLARLAAELVQRQVAVIVTTRSPYAAEGRAGST